METRRDRAFHLPFRRYLCVTPISVEAEFHYRVVAKELERDQPAGDTNRTFIFSSARPIGSSFKRSAPGKMDGRDSFAGQPLYPARSREQI